MNLFGKTILGLHIVFGGFCLCALSAPTLVEALQSANYQFQETSLGGTGVLNSQSANYQATSSGAILGVEDSASTSFDIQAGHQTTNDPALSFIINTPSVSFGPFSPAVAATATSSFQVINYTAYGYVVQMYGNSPSFSGHTITAMSSTAPSQVGTEQFGINLVANTSPASLGANPDQGQFGYGDAYSNYNTSDNYRFVDGETIASAPRSSGATIYTISYIVNVGSLTPAGNYSGDQLLLVIGTY
jgi:hypothetical protein